MRTVDLVRGRPSRACKRNDDGRSHVHFVREWLVFDDGKRRVVHELDLVCRRNLRERCRLGHIRSRVLCMHIRIV